MRSPPPGGDLRNRIGPIYLVMEENHVSDTQICSCIFAKNVVTQRHKLMGHADLVSVFKGVQQVALTQKSKKTNRRSSRLTVRSQQTHNYRTSLRYRTTHGSHTETAGFSLNRLNS